MSYYDMPQDEMKTRGIDYDLGACLENNPQGAFELTDIDKVLAVWEGENDGDDWRWILRLKDERIVFLQGGCDYTGWDCQSWASHSFADTAEDAARKAIQGEVAINADHHPSNAGLGHMLNLIDGTYMGNSREVYESLMKQLADGKNQTWREEHDKLEGL